MTTLEQYNKAFCEALDLSADQLAGLNYQGVKSWDSVGHMSLIESLETAFDIMIETEDMIELNSYEKGKEILTEKYGVVF